MKYLGEVGFWQRQIVRDDLPQFIEDLYFFLKNVHAPEIEEWFEITEVVSNHRLLKRPITIELYTFAKAAKRLLKKTNGAAWRINKSYERKGRSMRLKFINRLVKRKLDKHIKVLEPYRHGVAAHRYTIGRKQTYIKIEGLVKLENAISLQKLADIWRSLKDCFEQITLWIENPVNANHLVLLKGSSKGDEP